MALSMTCSCGQVRGTLDEARAYARATCYCRDCQAYARFLGRDGLTDAHGGTDVVAMDPAGLRITSGGERLACVSLTDRGPLRWFATCCRTPIGNTARHPKVAYVGVPAMALTPARDVDEAFGPAGRTVLNTGSAKGGVSSTPLAFLFAGLRIVRGILGARLRGQADSPFFDREARPIAAPQVLDPAQRARLYAQS